MLERAALGAWKAVELNCRERFMCFERMCDVHRCVGTRKKNCADHLLIEEVKLCRSADLLFIGLSAVQVFPMGSV